MNVLGLIVAVVGVALCAWLSRIPNGVGSGVLMLLVFVCFVGACLAFALGRRAKR